MVMHGGDDDGTSVPAPSCARERALGALWAITGLAWLTAGYLALTLQTPAPPYYNFTLTLASVLLVVSTIVSMFYGSRRAYRPALGRLADEIEALREQVRERDEAWHTVNALLEPNGSNLRVLPSRINTGSN